MLDRLTQIVSPARCGGCGDALAAVSSPSAAWCEHCRVRWGPTAGAWVTGSGGCEGWAAAAYRGPVRRCILAAKAGAPGAAAELLRARLPADLLPTTADVTWVPGHPLRTIGAPDAGQSLARALVTVHRERGNVGLRREAGGVVGDEAPGLQRAGREGGEGLTLRRWISRSPTGRRQAGRSTDERAQNPHQLGLRVIGRPAGCVVVVDDVRTTGTTLDWVAKCLRAAGAERVIAITVALAPAGIA